MATADTTSRSNAELRELRVLLPRMVGHKLKKAKATDVLRLTHLYRACHRHLAVARSSGVPKSSLRETEALLATAHGILHRAPAQRDRIKRATAYFLHDCPRAIRAEWRLLTGSFIMVYGLALMAFALVKYNPELAFAMLDPGAVHNEISQLEALEPGESFHGNFTFGLGESPSTAAWIMVHNMGVGVLFFAAGLLPPLFLLLMATNGMMLGVYTAVAHGYGQAGSISSVLWCHGTLEIQAFVLAACAGLVLFRGLARPGAYTRSVAMANESKRAWLIMAPVFPILFCAGLIEGFISPHASAPVRIMVAISTGILLITWIATGGRNSSKTASNV